MRDWRRQVAGWACGRQRGVERSVYRGGCVNWFPQTGAGSLAQFPMERARSWRRISNMLENGERISLPDYGAAEVLWDLTWEDLTDAESSRITSLFQAMR